MELLYKISQSFPFLRAWPCGSLESGFKYSSYIEVLCLLFVYRKNLRDLDSRRVFRGGGFTSGGKFIWSGRFNLFFLNFFLKEKEG